MLCGLTEAITINPLTERNTIFTTAYRNRAVQFSSHFLLSPVSFWQICFFGPDLMHSKTLINTGEKKIAGIACFTIPTIFHVVAGEGFEPTTSGLWARRATSCSTPRYELALSMGALIEYHRGMRLSRENFKKGRCNCSALFWNFLLTISYPYGILSKLPLRAQVHIAG